MKRRNIIIRLYLLTLWVAYAVILISSIVNYEADVIPGYGSFKLAAAIPFCSICIILSVVIVSIYRGASEMTRKKHKGVN